MTPKPESPKSATPPKAGGFDPRDGFFPQGLLNKIDEIPPAPIVRPAPVAEPAKPNRTGLTVAVIVIALLAEGAAYFAWKAYKEREAAPDASKAAEQGRSAQGAVVPAPAAEKAPAPAVPVPAHAPAGPAKAAAEPSRPPEPLPAPGRLTVPPRATTPRPAAEGGASAPAAAPKGATPCTDALAALGLCTPTNNEKASR